MTKHWVVVQKEDIDELFREIIIVVFMTHSIINQIGL